jgi:cell division protein YceG involved in septum cleavage
MMSIKIVKIKKIIIVILTVIVGLLVIYALYSNKSRFYSSETIKYSQITIDENTDINEVISEFSEKNNEEKIISEIKKVNNLSNLNNESVYGKTLFIPIIEN